MIPLAPTLVLSFLSFISSVFVILRIIIPILPPHPLSRRVPPSEFGLPNFRSLSPANKTHVWLAFFDLFALAIFIWQVVMESYGGPTGYGVAGDVGSSVRIWFAMTIRQTCLLVVASLTLLHVRMGHSVSLGKKHWVLWAPTILLATTSTALAGVMAGAGVRSFFIGLVAYSSTIVIFSSAAFGCLLGTLVIIRRNLAVLNDSEDWPPPKPIEEKPRPSFATEEIDALRDGSSWITSNASSRHGSVSGWSFSTQQTGARSNQGSLRANIAKGSHPSIPPKSSFWFNPTTPGDLSVPPVPPLPSPYRMSAVTIGIADDPDPFRRDVPAFTHSRKGSQSSWLTSPSASQVTLSQWSYPTTRPDGTVQSTSVQDFQTDLAPSAAVSRPLTPAMANAQVLGGYGYAPEKSDSELGLSSLSTTPASNETDVSVCRAMSWLVTIWVPFGLSLPYLFMVCLGYGVPTQAASILLILSVTLSAPILVLNIIFHSPIPIPQGLFDTNDDSLAQGLRVPSPNPSFAHEYKRSGSVTVVEGRRSTDVWLTKGDAVDGNGKLSRAISMLAPKPKLSMLPPEEGFDHGEVTPPLPMQLDETPVPFSLPQTPHSEMSAELGKLKRTSSHISAGNDSMAYQTQIMVAQRHYSALAQTVVVPPSPGKQDSAGNALSASTAVATKRSSKANSHLRTRSISSVNNPRSQSISPPPSFPLPPTPPSVKAARLAQLGHKKSFSSGFSFGAIDDINEIDALSAGVLPMLVPGLKLGNDMKIKADWDFSPPGTFSKGSKTAKKAKGTASSEFGALGSDDFESPEFKHSTPAGKGAPRPKKSHKKHHFSLPSLGLGKEGMSWAAWTAEISRALENKIGQASNAPTSGDTQRRNTVWGGEAIPNNGTQLNAVREEDDSPSKDQLVRGRSTRSRGLRADVPLGVDSARNSVTTLLSEVHNNVDDVIPPPSAASTATLFEPQPAPSSSGPEAQSTPQNIQETHALSISKRQGPKPPMAQKTKRTSRRSSIVYIKSDSDDAPTASHPDPTTQMTPGTFSQWSSRAVRPLLPKASKLQPKVSGAKIESPSAGLRQLSLLQDRGNNVDGVQMSPGGTRPLLLSKLKTQDENMPSPTSSTKHRKLKPLQLARSETSKLRGILRKDEVLPHVIVRPPSTSQRHDFGHDVR